MEPHDIADDRAGRGDPLVRLVRIQRRQRGRGEPVAVNAFTVTNTAAASAALAWVLHELVDQRASRASSARRRARSPGSSPSRRRRATCSRWRRSAIGAIAGLVVLPRGAVAHANRRSMTRSTSWRCTASAGSDGRAATGVFCVAAANDGRERARRAGRWPDARRRVRPALAAGGGRRGGRAVLVHRYVRHPQGARPDRSAFGSTKRKRSRASTSRSTASARTSSAAVGPGAGHPGGDPGTHARAPRRPPRPDSQRAIDRRRTPDSQGMVTR